MKVLKSNWGRISEEQKSRYRKQQNGKYAVDESYRLKKNAVMREWTRLNPERRIEQRLKKKYGISLKQRQDLLVSQGGSCAICGYSDLSRRQYFPVVDHCHKSGTVRGLLCADCNHAIGKLHDDPALLMKAADYISKFQKAS